MHDSPDRSAVAARRNRRIGWLRVLAVLALSGLAIATLAMLVLLRSISESADTSNEAAFQTMTDVAPSHPLQAQQAGWEDYQGWFRVVLSPGAVERAAGHLGARLTQDCLRREALHSARIYFNPPEWWNEAPDRRGRCWRSTDFTTGGAVVHYDEDSQIATILIFSL